MAKLSGKSENNAALVIALEGKRLPAVNIPGVKGPILFTRLLSHPRDSSLYTCAGFLLKAVRTF
jgi:hypothetical protein